MMCRYVLKILLFHPLTILCSRYDYLAFENFELTKSNFLLEQEVVRNLQHTRNILHQQLSDLKQANENIVTPNNSVIDITKERKNVVPNIYISQHKSCSPLNGFYNIYKQIKAKYNKPYPYKALYSISAQDLLIAACKGVIMLQETYDQNITEFSKGHLRIKSDLDKSSRMVDSLRMEDLMAMSNVAFNFYKWYDTALKYLKRAIHIFPSTLKKNSVNTQHLEIENKLSSMKREYPLYHNDMFDKKTNFIGPDWKMYPNKVDMGKNDIILYNQMSLNQKHKYKLL